MILRQIAEIADLATLWRNLTQLVQQRGFGASAYYLTRMASHLPLSHGFDRKLLETYASYDFQRLDVVPRTALAAGVPVSWLEIWRGTELTPEEQQLYAALMASGMQDGYSLPCYGPNGRNAVVSVGMMSTDAAKSRQELDVLHYIMQAAHLRICALFDGSDLDKLLSRREKQILDWVARGKSNAVIADILNISVSTVDTYMRRIYQKLDVSDRTSAAVKGVGLGLIAA